MMRDKNTPGEMMENQLCFCFHVRVRKKSSRWRYPAPQGQETPALCPNRMSHNIPPQVGWNRQETPLCRKETAILDVSDLL